MESTPGAPAGIGLGLGAGSHRRGLGIEELTGAAEDILDTLPRRCAGTLIPREVAQLEVTVSRPGGRSTGRCAEPC